jgi:hypothetical protein
MAKTGGKLTEDFLAGLKEIESTLSLLNFYPYSFEEKGPAYFIKYKRGNSIVEFLFGPSGWEVEMIIFTSKGKFAFKDLLQIPAIAEWVDNNRYKQYKGRSVRNELLWAIELLKTSLPIIE